MFYFMQAKLLSTTIVIIIVGYLFLVYTNYTLNPVDLVVRTPVDWANASRLELTAPEVCIC